MTKREKQFFSLIQVAANEAGAKFFMDSGEGRPIITDDLDGEDFSGWLIPQALTAEFEQSWKNGTQNDDSKWDEFFTFAEWEKNGERVIIRFNKHAAA